MTPVTPVPFNSSRCQPWRLHFGLRGLLFVVMLLSILCYLIMPSRFRLVASEITEMTVILFPANKPISERVLYMVPDAAIPSICTALSHGVSERFPSKWKVFGTISCRLTSSAVVKFALYKVADDELAIAAEGGGYYRGIDLQSTLAIIQSCPVAADAKSVAP